MRDLEDLMDTLSNINPIWTYSYTLDDHCLKISNSEYTSNSLYDCLIIAIEGEHAKKTKR